MKMSILDCFDKEVLDFAVQHSKKNNSVPSQIRLHLLINRLTIDEIAKQLNISPRHFKRILDGERTLHEYRLNQINELLETNFQPTPDQPQLLPHEQFESDKEKAKSLFKEP